MAKYEYAKSIGVGMMCWAYTEDTSNIVIDAIYEAMNK
jgi:GH18 family chitinase